MISDLIFNTVVDFLIQKYDIIRIKKTVTCEICQMCVYFTHIKK